LADGVYSLRGLRVKNQTYREYRSDAALIHKGYSSKKYPTLIVYDYAVHGSRVDQYGEYMALSFANDTLSLSVRVAGSGMRGVPDMIVCGKPHDLGGRLSLIERISS